MKTNSALEELELILSEVTSTSLGRRAFLQAVPLLMVACASGPDSRMREGDNSGQETELTVADEKKMTAEALPQMRKDYPPLEDPELQSYLTNVGTRMVQANGLVRNPYQYSFTVVDVPMVNAFALPAGTIFVTAPLLAMAETEAELAGVIGHEIGHVKARHTAERMEKAKKSSSQGWLYGIGGGLLGAAAGFGAGKLLCRPRDNACLERAAAIGAAAGVGGGLLVQKYKFMANTREDEMEADRIAFRTSVKAGYDKDHVGAFYSKLLRMEEASTKGGAPLMTSLSDAVSTHPPSRERVAQMEELSTHQAKTPNAVVTTSTFEKYRKRAASFTKKV